MDATTREKYAILHSIISYYKLTGHAHVEQHLGAVYFEDTLLNKPCIYIGICLYIHEETLEGYKELIIEFTWERIEWEVFIVRFLKFLNDVTV